MNYKTLATKFEGTRQELLKLLGLSSDSEATETTSEESTTDYASMKVTELKGLAKERNLKGYSTLKKAELVELLNNN